MQLDRRRLVQGSAAAFLAAAAVRPAEAEAPAPAGGATPAGVWRRLPTELFKGKQDDIVFVSRKVGWYGNGSGKLYRTLDGGESWAKVWDQPGTFIRSLGFLDESNGFLGNVGVGYYPNVTDTRPLYRTRDGGLTWTAVEASGIEIIKGVCGIDILPQRRIFQGELRNTPLIHAAGRVGGPAAMLRSVDGGESWRVIDLREHAGMILDVKFHDADNGLVCAASSDNLEIANALILRTADGGRTWSQAYRSSRPFENCWKMSFPTRKVGYATVQNYQDGVTQRVVVKTTDGGASWRELPLVEDAKAQEFGVGFVNEAWGWVGTLSSGYETRDGGASWTPVEMGRAVNKIRIVREGQRFSAFAIGVQVSRLDG
jgi:photosystem II stability/assembly factor-like uncharacterized protein